ncbi:MAG: 50S ribosomal protein L10 [Aeromicrobium sp.]|nr:MAG: 50S ribosomal protein L10 [Aeromicrobium sp.]
MARPDKTAAVAELAESFRESNGAVLTEYRGLSVKQLKELRRSLGDTVSYTVAKNTLTKLAAKDAGIDLDESLLTGPTAIAFINGDAVEAAKGLRDFAKANAPLVIKGGFLDGKALTADDVKKLADLESREVLLAKLAGGLKANLSKAAGLFNAPLSQAARTLAALQAKAEADPSVLAAGEPVAEVATEPVAEVAEEVPAEAPAEAETTEAADEAPAEAAADTASEDATTEG